jgi:hypothetical protein
MMQGIITEYMYHIQRLDLGKNQPPPCSCCCHHVRSCHVLRHGAQTLCKAQRLKVGNASRLKFFYCTNLMMNRNNRPYCLLQFPNGLVSPHVLPILECWRTCRLYVHVYNFDLKPNLM